MKQETVQTTKPDHYVLYELLIVCALLFLGCAFTIGYLCGRLVSPDLAVERARAESLQSAADFAKWEAVSRTFVPPVKIDLEGLSE
jgi:hypothetical protein